MMPYRPTSEAHPVREKFALTRKELTASLIERDDEVDLVLTALLANEHVLLVGPPGCGKSLLLDAVMNWMSARKFSILLTKFTPVEEVMGPVSLSALKEDRYRRVTAGRLPEAEVCFIDELWKASSAILNTLLKVLNERVCHAAFVDRIQDFLNRVGGRLLRFPVPAGTGEGDRSVTRAVADGLAAVVAEHRAAVEQFGTDTRDDTLRRAAERIRATKFKLAAYAEYLAGEKDRLDRALAEAERELREKVETIAAAPAEPAAV